MGASHKESNASGADDVLGGGKIPSRDITIINCLLRDRQHQEGVKFVYLQDFLQKPFLVYRHLIYGLRARDGLRSVPKW